MRRIERWISQTDPANRALCALGVLAMMFILILTGCTEQERARNYGGDATITLDTGLKLETITWKEGAELWYLTRLRRPGEIPETHVFHQERALWGNNGTVTIVER